MRLYLTEQSLKQLLTTINSDKNTREKYESIWVSMVHFLMHNSGLKISKVAQAGSFAKRTGTRESDLDVIFCVVPDQSAKVLFPPLAQKLQQNFPHAKVSVGNAAIHVKFLPSNFDVDLVIRSDSEFKFEHRMAVNIRQLESTDLDSIKLVKWAVSAAGLVKSYPSYLIEKYVWGIRGIRLNLHNLVEHMVERITSSQRKLFPNSKSTDAVIIFEKLNSVPK